MEEGEYQDMEEGEYVQGLSELIVLEELGDHHSDLQEQYGDALPVQYQSQLPTSIQLSFEQSDLRPLKLIWRSLGRIGQREFRSRYGDIALLLDVDIETEVLQAAVYFWDPTYRCFVFGKHDMVPTVEEYQDLLRIPNLNREKIYWPRQPKRWQATLRKLTGLPRNVTDELNRGNKVRAEHIVRFAKGDSEHRIDALALLIYSQIVFPKELGMVDATVIDFLDMVRKGMDPAPAILAETLRTLSYCRQSGHKTRFIGCAQLLSIWFKSHFGYQTSSEAYILYDQAQPILEYRRRKWPPRESRTFWLRWFKELEESDIAWRAMCFQNKKIPYCDRNMPWIPLPGIWGVIGYSPLLVRRQYGAQQKIPYTHGIDSLNLTCSDDKAYTEAKGWGQMYQKVKWLDFSTSSEPTTENYRQWHERRVKDIVTPRALLDPVAYNTEDLVTELLSDNERLRNGSEVKALTMRIAELEKEVAKMKASESEYVINARQSRVDIDQALKMKRKAEEELEKREDEVRRTYVSCRSAKSHLRVKVRQVHELKEIEAETAEKIQKLKESRNELGTELQELLDSRVREFEELMQAREELACKKEMIAQLSLKVKEGQDGLEQMKKEFSCFERRLVGTSKCSRIMDEDDSLPTYLEELEKASELLSRCSLNDEEREAASERLRGLARKTQDMEERDRNLRQMVTFLGDVRGLPIQDVLDNVVYSYDRIARVVLGEKEETREDEEENG